MGRRGWALLALQSVALSFVAAWPMPLWFPYRTLGHPNADGAKHLWTLWWMRREAWAGTPGLTTTWVNFPDGAPLYPVEVVDGLFAALLPLAPLQVANVTALLHLALLGVCAGALGGRVSGRIGGALATAALWQMSAWTAFTLQVGVGELRQAWWLPLGFLVLLEARRRRGLAAFALLGATIAAATAACFYYGFLLAAGVGAFAVAEAREEVRSWRGWALAVVTCLVLLTPVLLVFAAGWGDDTTPLLDGGRVTRDYATEALALPDLLTPRLDRDAAPAAEQAYFGGRYLGWIALALAAWGARSAPRAWLAVGGAGLALAMGTVLLHEGEVVRIAGAPVLLPLGWVYDALGGLAAPPNFPARFLALTSLAVAVLAGVGARGRIGGALVVAAIVEVAACGIEGWPRRTFSMPSMAGLRVGGGEGAVADLSLSASPDQEVRVLAMAAQMELGRPIQAVPIERLDRWSASGADFLGGLALVKDLAAVQHHQVKVAPDRDYAVDLAALRARGFDRVLLTHRSTGVDLRSVEFLTRILGAPVATAKRGTLWAVPE